MQFSADEKGHDEIPDLINDFKKNASIFSYHLIFFVVRSVIGGFVDNHDNPRFLNLNPSHTAFRNALTYVLMGDWIPIVYYGTEQGFNGGSDPNNRESLWPFMSTENPLYKFIQTLVHFRRSLGDDWLQNRQVM